VKRPRRSPARTLLRRSAISSHSRREIFQLCCVSLRAHPLIDDGMTPPPSSTPTRAGTAYLHSGASLPLDRLPGLALCPMLLSYHRSPGLLHPDAYDY